MMGLRTFIMGAVVYCAGFAHAAERVALPTPPSFFRPFHAVTVTEHVLAKALFTGLVRHDAQGRIMPGLAESWTVNLTGLEYRFQLSRNATWVDGKPIDARTIVESFSLLLDPSTNVAFPTLLLPIKNAEAFRLGVLAPDQKLGVSAPDKNTLVITLDRPSHRFLDVLASPVAAPVPAHRLNLLVPSEPEAMVGNGPFTLVKKKNAYALKPRKAPGREFEITSDPEAADIAFGFVAPVTTGGQTALYQMLVNVRHTPLNERDVRHALSMVIDREALAATLPKASAAYGLSPDALQAPYARLSPDDRKTVAEALLLDIKRDRPIRVVFPDQPIHHDVGAALVKAWTPLGFKVDLQVLPSSVYESAILDGAFDVAWLPPWTLGHGAVGHTRADQLFLFSQAAGPWNAGGYQEPAFDQYLASADADQSADGGQIQLRAAEDVLVEDQPAWPLFFYSTSAPQNFDVLGWTAASPQ